MYRQLPSRPRSASRPAKDEDDVASPDENKVPSFRDKTMDMSVRLELWRAEKKKQQLSNEVNKLKISSTKMNYYTGDKSNIPLTKTTKLLNKKFKTPTKEYRSPSTKDTYKDTDLDMRTRLELWLKDKGKTPQTPTLSKRGFPKTPAGTTPNQRRKTWCHSESDNKSKSVGTPRRIGILKHGKSSSKSCSSILRNKENLVYQNVASTPSDSSKSNASGKMVATVEEEKVLIQSLEKCYEMFLKDACTQEEIVFSLDDIQRDHPNVLRHALYWICRAKLAENVGDHERVVCMLEQASSFSAQPKELVQKYFEEYKSRKPIEGRQGMNSPLYESRLFTPHKTPSRGLSKLDGEVFNSSVVRFCLIDATPVRNRRKSASEKLVLTPVRRTTRWERCGITHPKTIEEKKITVASLNELSSPIRSTIVYKPNSLLPCELDEEMKNVE